MNEQVTSKVSVFVRCRPLTGKEKLGNRCLSIQNDTIQVGDKVFNFEGVFGEESDQFDIYSSCVTSLVGGCFQGYNGTVFACKYHYLFNFVRSGLTNGYIYYMLDGQTGSGKTHSIMGAAGIDEEEEGIIPRAVKDIFQTLRGEKADRLASVNIRVSMLEIYNDDCRDLLHPDIPSRDIMIREDRDGRIFFTGAREEVVADVRSAMAYLEKGNLNRTTAETLMNLTSSRSHVSIACIHINIGALININTVSIFICLQAVFTISIEVLELVSSSRTHI